MVDIDEKADRKRIANLEEDESLERVELLMPKSMLDKLKQKALDKDVSRASIVREALSKWFKEQENPSELNPEAIIPDKDLDEILETCSTYYGGFEIDGESGFIETMKASEFLLKDLTPEQWDRVKEKLSIGFSGYTFKPSLEEFAEKFDVLEPTEEQRTWLSTETEEETTESEKT
jgi:hypothetical protein